LKLKFQTVAEKTAKNFKGLLYFAAPCRSRRRLHAIGIYNHVRGHRQPCNAQCMPTSALRRYTL